MINPVINLYRTQDEAFTFKSSQIDQFYRFGGVHLLPNNAISYVQVTNTPDGINLEDWTVFAVDLCKGTEVDITPSFVVIGTTNSLNGDPQVIWQLTNVPVDNGVNLTSLRIEQSLGETFYSQPFILSDYGKEKTTQFHYKDKKADTLQSIGFKCWFRQDMEQDELTTYYQTSTNMTTTASLKVSQYSVFKTETMAIDEIKRLRMVLRSPYLYTELYQSYLFEAPEFPTTTGDENFGSFEIKLSISKTNKLVL